MLRKIHGLWIYTEQHSYTTITKGCVFLNSSSQHVFIYTAVFVTNVCHIQRRCSSLEYLTTGLTNGRGSNYRSSFSFLFSLPSLTGSPGEKKKKSKVLWQPRSYLGPLLFRPRIRRHGNQIAPFCTNLSSQLLLKADWGGTVQFFYTE